MADEKVRIGTEQVGGGLTNEATKATATNESGDTLNEAYAEGLRILPHLREKPSNKLAEKQENESQ
jgi:hypothetical protein